MRLPLAFAGSLVALVGLLAAIGSWRTPAVGPMPTGTRIADGVVLAYDASDGATAIVAEVRGLRTQPGAVREVLYVAREPFERDDFEALGRGAALGEISPDGRFVSWLASKERGERTGPGRLRAVEANATPLKERALLPPVAFDRDAPRAVSLGSYQAAPGRGTLLEFDLAAGASKILSPNVPAGAFGLLADGRTFALRRPHNVAQTEAVVLSPAVSPALLVAANVDGDDPAPAFRIAPDRRAVTLRLAPDAAGRRALVRWRDGGDGLAPVAPDAAAWTLDREGRAWWVSSADGALRAYRERENAVGEPVYLGEAAGREPRSVHPLPSDDGAWIALGDRPCVASDGASLRAASGGAAIVAALAHPRGGCIRLVRAGAGAEPPDIAGLRRVVSPPEGWPVVLLGPVAGAPAFVAVGTPGAPIAVDDGGLLGTAISIDGRFVAARVQGSDGERIVLVDLAAATTTVLAEQAPESLLSWHGDALVYVWRNRWWRLDPRNGLYRVQP